MRRTTRRTIGQFPASLTVMRTQRLEACIMIICNKQVTALIPTQRLAMMHKGKSLGVTPPDETL